MIRVKRKRKRKCMLLMLIALGLSSCAPNIPKPNGFQTFIGSTKCQDGRLFKAIKGYPHWRKIGSCGKGNKTGSIFN